MKLFNKKCALNLPKSPNQGASGDKDRENWLAVLNVASTFYTMTYAGDGLRRSKFASGRLSTYTWDITNYLMEETS